MVNNNIENEPRDSLPVSKQNTGSDSDKSAPHQPVIDLAKKFAIAGALIPEEQQLLIEERTSKRVRLSALRKQNNIENIMKKTLSYSASTEVGQRTDHDWFTRYISLSEDVSNPTMQELWAKILAGELNKQGSFSYKALQVFKDMSIFDAKLLAKACSFAIKDQNKKNIRLLSGVYQQPGFMNFFSKNRNLHVNLSQYGLNHSDLLALADNHLIYLQESESSLINNGDVLPFNYNGQQLNLTATKSNVNIQFYKFTAIGAELANLITDKGNDEFFNYLKNTLSHFFIINTNS